MEEIQVGEYVRTKWGFIAKVSGVDEKWLYRIYSNGQNRQTFSIGRVHDIETHSFDIKKLIKAGDLVKYRLKGMKAETIGVVRKNMDARSGKEGLGIEFYSLEQLEIISIVTKEQMKAMEYEVK